MTTSAPARTAPATTAGDRRAPQYLPLLLILFVGSGCAALIYEVVWFQLLQLVIGSSAVSIGVLLGTFMGGMCLGSLLFSRLVSPSHHPLRTYALLEIAIGLVAVAITLGMPLFDYLYIALASTGSMAIFVRAIVCAICLLPPTILMGATLPAISRWIETTPRGVSWLGFFYGGNTAGAVAGSLFAGFYLLRHFDMTTATFIAAGLNLAVGAVGLSLAALTRHESSSPEKITREQAEAEDRNSGSNLPVYIVIALSGMSALGAEVVWTRLLSLLLGGTVYTFSLILAVFLLGLGIGSSIGAMLSRSRRSSGQSRLALAWCQILCAAGIAWTAYALTNGVPNWPVNPFDAISRGFLFQVDLARTMWAILPATLFWGASFPLALAAAITPGRDPARVVGRVYAANTIGAIVGAVLASLWLIPAFGTQTSEHVLIGIAALAALVAVISAFSGQAGEDAFDAVGMPPAPSTVGMLFTLIVAVALPAGAIYVLAKNGLDTLPWRLVAYGRRIIADDRGRLNDSYAKPLYVGEGMNSSVAVTELSDGQTRRFHVSGKVEASSLPEDMRLQLMLGHFPALFHPKPEKVLIVGCGAGVTAGSFILHPSIKKIVICEIEPLVPKVVATYFGPQNNNVVTRKADGSFVDDRVEVVYDDARHYILTTREKFDIITSDPIHPWVKGAATLYTEDYFNLVKAHLNPGGIVTQWVPLYESSESAVKSEIATFSKVFPNATLWNNDDNGAGYDTVILGSNSDFHIDAAALERRLQQTMIISATLARSSFGSAVDILKTYAGDASDLGSWMQDAQINRDRNLRLQYLAGDSLNDNAATEIIDRIMSYRKFPKEMLIADPETQRTLERSWRVPQTSGAADLPGNSVESPPAAP